MKYRDRAIEALRQTESTLRGIITEAFDAKAYGELARVAGAADSVAALLSAISDTSATTIGSASFLDPAADSTRKRVSTLRSTPARQALPPAVRRAVYPRFLRDGERLVKIAWSKKERRQYEHRAPQVIIQTLLEAVRKRKGEGKLFQAADVLPLTNANGEDYPSYQSYLALSWLRHAGIITKKGREGYVLKVGAATPEKVGRLWASLPTEG